VKSEGLNMGLNAEFEIEKEFGEAVVKVLLESMLPYGLKEGGDRILFEPQNEGL
jgi:hypothetical protein